MCGVWCAVRVGNSFNCFCGKKERNEEGKNRSRKGEENRAGEKLGENAETEDTIFIKLIDSLG